MFYYLSVIGILITPPSPGSFDNLADCMKYKNIIEETVAQAPSAVILQSECKTKDKGRSS